MCLIPTTRIANKADRAELVRMFEALFPDLEEDLGAYVDEFLNEPRDPKVLFVTPNPNGGLSGFIEVGTRSVAEDCTTSPVAYVEAWYVDPDARRQGVGRALFRAAESWARAQGLKEIGSDVQIHNEVSITAHKALGYTETERLVTFLKVL